MDQLTFWESLIKDLIWPIIVVVIALIFKSKLLSLIDRIKEIDWDKNKIIIDPIKDKIIGQSGDQGKALALKQIDNSKLEAQQRLDKDTAQVGYQRGKLFQHEDGSWGIAWEVAKV